MKRVAVLPLFLLLTFCAGGRGGDDTMSQPGHGALSIQIVPNPIVARGAGGNMYDFPFEVLIRETGGRAVTIDRVSADVLALGSIPVANESYDSAKIAGLGYATTVPANGELRYRFTPRHEVTDERLFGGVSAQLSVEGRDDTGTPATARTTVTVTR
ncbi:MAG TPA: hypothetical protein VGF69_06350 [Thermoanaerobaculia bacterium]|jgi:hypothetical protein